MPLEPCANVTDEARGHHDVGGEAEGPIPREEREPAGWEWRCAALRVALGARGLVPLEELRDAFESFAPTLYARLPFFERMLEAQLSVLERKGVVTKAEVDALAATLEEAAP